MHRSTGLAALAALLLLSAAPIASAQPAGGPAPTEAVTKHEGPSQGPIMVNWKMKKIDGSATLTINPDGTYLFSGQVSDKKPERDYDISVALKSKAGIVLFHYVGNDKDGVQWSDQGTSDILQEDFGTFAKGHEVSWMYDFPLSKEGRAKRFHELKEKRDKLRHEAHEAHEKHDQQEAAKRQALKEEEQRQLQEEQQAHSGGGSNVAGDIENVASTVGSVVSSIGGAVSDVLSFF